MDWQRSAEEYIDVAFKGVANVSPADRKKLAGIIEHYRKKPHPFRACVRDNRRDSVLEQKLSAL